jgi:hypothetical protein
MMNVDKLGVLNEHRALSDGYFFSLIFFFTLSSLGLLPTPLFS